MATPNFDKELLRIRRKIADVYVKEHGVPFVEGDPTLGLDRDGNALSSKELVDIWNESVRCVMKILCYVFERGKIDISKFFPGYIISIPSILSVYGETGEYQADYIDLSGILENNYPYFILQVNAGKNTRFVDPGKKIGVYFEPTKFFEVYNGTSKIFNNQTMFTMMTVSLNSEYKRCLIILPKSPETPGFYSVTFIKQHKDIEQNGAEDLNPENAINITPLGLDMICDNCVREYMARRNFSTAEIIQNKMNENNFILGGKNDK